MRLMWSRMATGRACDIRRADKIVTSLAVSSFTAGQRAVETFWRQAIEAWRTIMSRTAWLVTRLFGSHHKNLFQQSSIDRVGRTRHWR